MQLGVAVAVAVGVGLAVAVAVGDGLAVGVGEGVPAWKKFTNTSCCDWPLMIVRPSVHAPMDVTPTELW